MLEAKRTLVKSPPELWEIVDDREFMGGLSVELFGSRAIEVMERRSGKRLAWRVADRPEARVELDLAEKGWGTEVAIRVSEQAGRGKELAGAVLERLLDQLGSAQRRPFGVWGSGAPLGGEDGERATSAIEGGIEATIWEPDRSASDRTSASAERRPVGRVEEEAASLERSHADPRAEPHKIKGVNPRSRVRAAERRKQEGGEPATARIDREWGGQSLDRLSELIMRRASEQTERARRAAEDGLAEAGERLRYEAEEADRTAWERIEEVTQRGLYGDERQLELALARRDRDRGVRAAERRLARQAAEIFARLERDAGRLQERARSAAAAGAAKVVDRRVERCVESALREIEDKLIAGVRRGVAETIVRRAETAAREPVAERSARAAGAIAQDQGARRGEPTPWRFRAK